MPLKDLSRLVAHWRKHPPTHMAVAALERSLLLAKGIEMRAVVPAPQASGFADESDVRSFVALANGG